MLEPISGTHFKTLMDAQNPEKYAGTFHWELFTELFIKIEIELFL